MLGKALLILLGSVSICKAIRFISNSLNRNQPVAVDDRSQDDLILTQTVSPPATKYDVFLSFRGEDTRHTFASYLYNGLRNAGIHTFMDHKLRKGEEISQALLTTIEESEISVIIFSENYASSTWCMDELVHILKCKEDYGRVVIPIFYKVNPSNIRKQNGSFGTGFDVLKERSFNDNQGKLKNWRNALIQSASLSGWDSNVTRPESKLVEEIVKDILSKLKLKYKLSSHLEGLVGIAPHIANIEKLLTEARIVGIWGMGGAGKTTLAKALFHELKPQFDAFSFLDNVKEQLKRISLDELQKNCLEELLKDDDDINIYDIESTFVRSRLGRKKVLVILDDVDNSIIAEDLTRAHDRFGEGSRIIITSRDMQVLKNASAFSTYHVPELDFDDAFHLFSLKAFKHHEPYEGYMELSKSVVKYCQGNPLALKVLGCFLYGRGKEYWESYLEKLNRDPPKEIVDVQKSSFDGLDYEQQNVFLDLAFLFKERFYVSLNLITQLYGPSAHIEISVLTERSLISCDHKGYIKISMHDLVREMGLEIARQQLLFSPKIPVRLCGHEEIYNFFICDKGIEAIRCLSLDTTKIKRITWAASHFRKMHNLICLKVYRSDWGKPSNLNICEDFDYLPEGVKCLSWEGYPIPSLPLHGCAENLITLDLCNSNIRQLWDGDQHFPNLEQIHLKDSEHITAIDLSHTPKIELMLLKGCVNLDKIHSSTVPEKHVQLFVDHCEQEQINIGGAIKGTSSGTVIVYNCLDPDLFLFHKVTMKLFASGKTIHGIRFKHVVIPLAEIVELISILPFVRKADWFDTPIEFGDDFKQHYICWDELSRNNHPPISLFDFSLRVTGDREGDVVAQDIRSIINEEERYSKSSTTTLGREMIMVDQLSTMLTEVEEMGVVGPLRREIIIEQLLTMLTEVENVDERDMIDNLVSMLKEVDDEDVDEREMINDVLAAVATSIKEQGKYSCTTTLMKVEEEEEEDDECCSNSDSLLTRLVPNSITRWSLLTRLTLNQSDITGNAAYSNNQVSILKLLADPSRRDEYCRRNIKPHLDVKFSFENISPSTSQDHSFCVRYKLRMKLRHIYQSAVRVGGFRYHLKTHEYQGCDRNFLLIEYQDCISAFI